MKNTNIRTNHIMSAPITQSLAAARSVMSTEALVDLLVEKQVNELSKIRKKYPDLPRLQAIKIALLNSAYQIKINSKTETYCLLKIKKSKKNPQLDWLKIHKSFILDLANKSASLREIEAAVFYRFHHKISHTQISKFLKIEEKNHVA